MLLLDFTTSECKQQKSRKSFWNLTLQHLRCPQDGSVPPSESHSCSLTLLTEKYLKEDRDLLHSHHDAGVELVETLHGAIAEAVAQVFLDKVGVVQDVVGHQRLLATKQRSRAR